MKKQSKRKARTSDQMRPEYDFSKGVRGKHAARYASGTNVVVLAPDVASQFRTADDVNETLRAVARLMQRRRGKEPFSPDTSSAQFPKIFFCPIDRRLEQARCRSLLSFSPPNERPPKFVDPQ